MARKRLTEEGVRKLKPTPNKQVDYFDAVVPGLILRISYGGTKTWNVLHYEKRSGKTVPRAQKLGRYPILNLKQAREAARTFLENPQAALAKAAEQSFREVVADFLHRHVEAKELRTGKEVRRYLEDYACNFKRRDKRLLGDVPFAEMRLDDLTELFDHIEDHGSARQADKVLAAIRKMTRWYQARHAGYLNPL